jgi:transposase
MFTSGKVMPNRKVMPDNDRDLTNAQWEILDSLIPQPTPRSDGRGRPWKDRRAVLNGILWILRSGAPWADVPDRYPSYQTCHRRFQQ